MRKPHPVTSISFKGSDPRTATQAPTPGNLGGPGGRHRRVPRGRKGHAPAYSCRRASMGSIMAARRAGYSPNRMPTATEMPNDSRTDMPVTNAFWSGMK